MLCSEACVRFDSARLRSPSLFCSSPPFNMHACTQEDVFQGCVVSLRSTLARCKLQRGGQDEPSF
jgi:hypothetical protein